MNPRPLFPRAILVAAGVLALVSLAAALLADSVAAWLLAGPLPVFPGHREAAYYADQLRVAALSWGVILPALILLAGVVLSPSDAPQAGQSARFRFAVLGVVAFAALTASALTPRRLTGDEPAYQAMALSLARDGTLDVANADETLHRSPAAKPGENRSVHDPGLSMVLALPAVAGGARAARCAGALLALALVAALRLPSAASLAGEAATDRAALAIAVSFPVAAYAPMLLPELAGAVAVTVLFVEVVIAARPSFLSAAAVAALPWLHVRFLPPAALLTLWVLWRRSGRRRGLLMVAAPLVATLGVMAAAHLRWFGSPSPFAMWRGREELVSIASLIPGTFGILVDQQAGLLIWAPLFLLVPLGAGGLWRRRPDVVVGAVAVAAACAGPGVLVEWWGGWSPPARFLVAAIGPLCFLAATGLVETERRGFPGRVLARVLLAAQLMIGAFCLAVPGKLFGTFEARPRNYVLDLAGRAIGVDTTWLVPSLLSQPGASSTVHAALLVVAWALMTWALSRTGSHQRRSARESAAMPRE